MVGRMLCYTRKIGWLNPARKTSRSNALLGRSVGSTQPRRLADQMIYSAKKIGGLDLTRKTGGSDALLYQEDWWVRCFTLSGRLEDWRVRCSALLGGLMGRILCSVKKTGWLDSARKTGGSDALLCLEDWLARSGQEDRFRRDYLFQELHRAADELAFLLVDRCRVKLL
ncbi:hypothetical protein ZIOFF_064294 [Zingiber officinale]|uniref:Uncharacterized protein n=1 Tax=Zingiber officinale TaxID=94328 RepID=A0A8J5EVT1_ZINOF|nr:hypothetical protein ZIOFF_064294 [Zingiber officinale]